jgi:hypothetical protein
MEHPVEAVLYVPVKLSADKAVSGGEHVVLPRPAGAGGVEKTHGALLALVIHSISINPIVNIITQK